MPDPSCLEKKISVRKIKAELLKEYVMSLKKKWNALVKTPVTRKVSI